MDTVPRSEFIAIRKAKEEQEAALETLKDAVRKMLGAIRAGAFIIPNRGLERDQSIAAYDGLLEAMEMKPGDVGPLESSNICRHGAATARLTQLGPGASVWCDECGFEIQYRSAVGGAE